MIKKNLVNPPKKYRPVPFWSWNEKLNIAETKRQIDEMCDAGIGGFFMHARGGLQTEYMSGEWFDNVRAAIDEAEVKGMRAWGYDENGWPSGFGSGAVNGMGVKYRQKYLRYEFTDSAVNCENTIVNLDFEGKNMHFYYEINPFYVDTLDGEVVDEFIKSTHQVYKDTLKEKFVGMDGFFTDEPQVSRNGMPWSFILESEYRKAYGAELAPLLPALFIETDGYKQVRYNFWKLVRDLFAENFMGRIHDWCQKNGSKLTGHMVIEEGFYNHVFANGCCMPPYEYMDIPGMDSLGRRLPTIQTEMQLTSVANQLGKKQILSETFALSGWNVSFEDLRRMYEHQMVHGVNYLCQHLEGYSLRGIRKRDYPASLFKHQPWWREYRVFNDMVSRIGMLIAEGEIDYNILVLHTVESAWVNFDVKNADIPNRLCNGMLETMAALENAQLQYHLGDSRIMERYGKAENGKLIVGTQSYSVVIVPPAECIGRNTFELLKKFSEQGGLIIFTEQKPSLIDGVYSDELVAFCNSCASVNHNEVASSVPESVRKLKLTYADSDKYPVITCVRGFKEQDMTMYYIVNSCDITHDITVTVKGVSATVFDYLTGEEKPAVFASDGENLNINCTLYGNNSLVLFVYDNDSHKSADCGLHSLKPLGDRLKGEWRIESIDDNALTLDYCDVYFNGEKSYENLPVSDVQEKALSFGKKVNTKVVFSFDVRSMDFGKCELVVETPEIFDIFVNGEKIEKKEKGFYHDWAFRVIDIYRYVKTGRNEIALVCDFEQSDQVYENAKKSLVFESEKNKLSYDMEIEAVYIKGDFEVHTDSRFEHLDRRALRTDGNFYLTGAKDTVTDGNLAEQGYPFFAGSVTLKKTVKLSADEISGRSFKIDRLCSTVTSVRVNGEDAGKIMWQPYELDLSGMLHEGDNEIEVTVIGNLRNLLGPFHLAEGECLSVCPNSFFHESQIWCKGTRKDWVDSYCFIEHGLFF